MLSAKGDRAGALASWEHLIELSPDRAYLAFERLERVHAEAGHPHRFQDRCRQIIASNPGDWRAASR